MKTEYTPTTDYLRETWVLDQMEDSMTRRRGAEASFDRWLAGYTREKQAEAWQDGFYKGIRGYLDGNPYN